MVGHLTPWNGWTLLQYTEQITILSDTSLSGLGGNLPGHKDWRPVVSTRERNAHQLSGGKGGHVGGSDVPQGSPGHLSAVGTGPRTGQPDGSGLHKQLGKTCVPFADSTGESSMVVGPHQGHSLDSPSHSGGDQLHSR